MPTYEYECRECGTRFERLQKMSDPPVQTCPQCDGEVERLISAGAGFILKGAGFYSNDYKNSRPSCGHDTPCCGREARCDHRPCH